MVAERRHIDLEDNPDLREVVDVVRENKEPVDIRIAGQVVAIVEPTSAWRPGDPHDLSTEEIAAFRASSGGWKGLVDIDEFLSVNEESRSRSSRVPS